MEQQQNVNSGDSNLLEEIDFGKLFKSLKKSIPWILAIMLFTNTISFLYVRYTKPVFESSSILKLEIESEANVLGFGQDLGGSGSQGLIGEIELLKSRLFYGKVAGAINYDVAYHFYGRYLTDERYKNSPFIVDYREVNSPFYDKAIDLTILDGDTYEVALGPGSQMIKKKFGELVEMEKIRFSIEKSPFFSEQESVGKYYFIINSNERVISYLQGNVNVRPENFNANTVRISLRDFNKQKANDFVNAIDTLYLSYIKDTKNQAIEQKIDFLDDQIAKTNERLEEFEDYFERSTIENRTINPQNDISKSIELLEVLDSQRIELKYALDNIKEIENQLLNNNPDVVNPLVAQGLPSIIEESIARYTELTSERKLKLESYNERTLVITRLDYQIREVREKAKELISEQKNILQQRLRTVDLQRRTINENFSELPSRSTEFNNKQRFYSLEEEFLLSLKQSKTELEITRAGTVNKSVILANASTPSVPVHPRKLIVYVIGLTSGLSLSLIFVLVRYLMQNNITSVKELENMVNIPILGAIPVYRKEKIEVSKVVIDENPKSAISEAFRSIRTNMDFLNADNSTKLITVTSTVSGEGKTFVGVNMAAIIAISGKKVCVVDLDMRKPKVSQAFDDGLPDEKGISTILIGRYELDECLRSTRIDSLSYISAGPTPPNPSELLLSKKFDSIVEQLKEKFDVIIFDTPPVGLVTDGVLVMKKSDLQIYVVRADHSKREYIKTLNNLVALNKFSNVTTVLNSLSNAGNSTYSYNYGYGYYEEDQDEGKFKSIFKIF